MKRLSEEEISQLNKDRAKEAARERGETYAAQVEAAREHGLWAFTARHCGYRAVANDSVYWSCIANDQLLTSYIMGQGRPVNEDTLETAFNILKEKGLLAEPPKSGPTVRKVVIDKGSLPQARYSGGYAANVPEPLALPGVTAQDIKSWPKEKLKKMMAAGYTKTLDRILNSK